MSGQEQPRRPPLHARRRLSPQPSQVLQGARLLLSLVPSGGDIAGRPVEQHTSQGLPRLKICNSESAPTPVAKGPSLNERLGLRYSKNRR